ncbi:MAG: nucleoside deaminase [bacterium]|nr:nucleoside deaminase [Candidatus Colousia faecequi]
MYEQKFMDEAIRVSIANIKSGGGPFGAVVVKNGEIISAEGNSVTITNDPTAHAEVNAIRTACRRLGTFDLEGCEIYASCEPCPMCLSAIYWAHIDRIYYAATREDTAFIGFDDQMIYDEIPMKQSDRQIPGEQHSRDTALEAFRYWRNKTDKTEY